MGAGDEVLHLRRRYGRNDRDRRNRGWFGTDFDRRKPSVRCRFRAGAAGSGIAATFADNPCQSAASSGGGAGLPARADPPACRVSPPRPFDRAIGGNGVEIRHRELRERHGSGDRSPTAGLLRILRTPTPADLVRGVAAAVVWQAVGVGLARQAVAVSIGRTDRVRLRPDTTGGAVQDRWTAADRRGRSASR